MKIGEIIERYIKQEGLRKADVAKQIGVSPQSLGNYLHSDRNIGFNTVEQIMNILGYEIIFRKITDDPSRLQRNPIYDLPDAALLTEQDLTILRNLATELIEKNKQQQN